MSLWNFLGGIVSPITGLFEKVDENKTKIAKRNIDRIMSADDKLAEWEAIQAEAGKHSWKDEFWTLILAIPLVMCFIPSTVPIIQDGFKVLETMPAFYQYWLGVAILASFGVRFLKGKQ